MAIWVGGKGSTQGLRVAKPKSKAKAKPKAKSLGTGLGKALSNTVKGYGGRVTGERQRKKYSSNSSSRRSSGNSRGNSGRSSGRNSGGGGGSVTTKAPKAPSAPSLSSYLGTDAVYQSAVSGNKRSLNDFLSEMERRKGEAGTQFTQTKGSMERDRVQQLEDLRNEFASRGLIQSGLYGEEQGNFQQKFTEQMAALEQQQAALLADLLGQTTNYRRENELSLEQAKQEAMLRRAQKYNIGA